MRPTITMAALAAATLLSACASGANVKEYRKACSDYGFRTGTDAHAGCVMQKAEADDDRAMVRSQMAAQERREELLGGSWSVEQPGMR